MPEYPLTHPWRNAVHFQRKRGRARIQDLKAAHERAKARKPAGSSQAPPGKKT